MSAQWPSAATEPKEIGEPSTGLSAALTQALRRRPIDLAVNPGDIVAAYVAAPSGLVYPVAVAARDAWGGNGALVPLALSPRPRLEDRDDGADADGEDHHDQSQCPDEGGVHEVPFPSGRDGRQMVINRAARGSPDQQSRITDGTPALSESAPPPRFAGQSFRSRFSVPDIAPSCAPV